MIESHIQATIYYRHSEDEVQELTRAIYAMREHIRAVSSEPERVKLRAILECDHFRGRDVTMVKNLLLRAAKHARAHMSEYFPSMQHSVVVAAEVLENAAEHYAKRFKVWQAQTIPVH